MWYSGSRASNNRLESDAAFGRAAQPERQMHRRTEYFVIAYADANPTLFRVSVITLLLFGLPAAVYANM